MALELKREEWGKTFEDGIECLSQGGFKKLPSRLCFHALDLFFCSSHVKRRKKAAPVHATGVSSARAVPPSGSSQRGIELATPRRLARAPNHSRIARGGARSSCPSGPQQPMRLLLLAGLAGLAAAQLPSEPTPAPTSAVFSTGP